MDSVDIGVILFFNLIIWGVSLLVSDDMREGVVRAIIGSVFITLLCVSVYLMVGGI